MTLSRRPARLFDDAFEFGAAVVLRVRCDGRPAGGAVQEPCKARLDKCEAESPNGKHR